jgi:hypothetical protein
MLEKQQELPRRLSGAAQTESLTELKQAKGFLQEPSNRRTNELLKNKQKPVLLGERTTYETLSPERAPLHHGNDR